MRVYPGKTYENQYIKFKMAYGEKWKDGPVQEDMDEDDTDPTVEAEYGFAVIDGYEEMYRNLGATDITDIEVAPNGELLLVDKAGEGLIVFDMLENFATIGGHIN